MKNKTAISQAIDELRNKVKLCSDSKKESRARKGAWVDAIVILQSLLPQERQQIEDAFKDAQSAMFDSSKKLTASDYFTQTYN